MTKRLLPDKDREVLEKVSYLYRCYKCGAIFDYQPDYRTCPHCGLYLDAYIKQGCEVKMTNVHCPYCDRDHEIPELILLSKVLDRPDREKMEDILRNHSCSVCHQCAADMVDQLLALYRDMEEIRKQIYSELQVVDGGLIEEAKKQEEIIHKSDCELEVDKNSKIVGLWNKNHEICLRCGASRTALKDMLKEGGRGNLTIVNTVISNCENCKKALGGEK